MQTSAIVVKRVPKVPVIRHLEFLIKHFSKWQQESLHEAKTEVNKI